MDVGARTWVPVTDGLHGHALFLSKRFSKSVFARDEVEADAIYFIDTSKVFNMRYKTTSPPNLIIGCLYYAFQVNGINCRVYFNYDSKSNYYFTDKNGRDHKLLLLNVFNNFVTSTSLIHMQLVG